MIDKKIEEAARLDDKEYYDRFTLSDEELELLITGLHCIDECGYNVYSRTCTPWSKAKEIKETLRVKLIRAQLNV